MLKAVTFGIAVLWAYFAKATSDGLHHYTDLGDGIQVIGREEWSALPAKSEVNFSTIPEIAVITHTAGAFCADIENCKRKVLDLQLYSQKQSNNSDIQHNYLIGGDGNIYVGRGPSVESSWNDGSMRIGYIGNFVFDDITSKMEEAGKKLLEKLEKEHKLSAAYRLVAHNQTSKTLSPGKIFEKIKFWPHYDPGLYFH